MNKLVLFLLCFVFSFVFSVSTNCNASAGSNVLDSYDLETDSKGLIFDLDEEIESLEENCKDQYICKYECSSGKTLYFNLKGTSYESFYVQKCLNQKKEKIQNHLGQIQKFGMEYSCSIANAFGCQTIYQSERGLLYNFAKDFKRLCEQQQTKVSPLKVFNDLWEKSNLKEKFDEFKEKKRKYVNEGKLNPKYMGYYTEVEKFRKEQVAILSEPCPCENIVPKSVKDLPIGSKC